MYKILLAGQDFQLLATRAAVLARSNASVVCCNAAETLNLLRSETFDLLVLCHSLAEADAAQITIAAHGRWQGTRILMVISAASRERFYRDVEFDATSSPEPDHLIRQVAELLDGTTALKRRCNWNTASLRCEPQMRNTVSPLRRAMKLHGSRRDDVSSFE